MVDGMKTAVLDSLYRASGPAAVDKLNKGLPASVFPELAGSLSVSTRVLARALGLSERTLRNRTRKLTGDEAERVFRVYRVLRRAEEVFADPEQARLWMTCPQPTLGQRRPLDLLCRDIGTGEVLGVLAAIEDGGYL
jgi:putative toxin-antitoxin system antitoxin component (TIGR02293 family)